jgi:hypothetical protein
MKRIVKKPDSNSTKRITSRTNGQAKIYTSINASDQDKKAASIAGGVMTRLELVTVT